MHWDVKSRRYGKVKIEHMKCRNVLQALSSLQAQSKNRRLYVQIG